MLKKPQTPKPDENIPPPVTTPPNIPQPMNPPPINPPPVNPPPINPPPINPPPKPGEEIPEPKPKKAFWPWILGGCAILIIIALSGVGILGWLGLRSAQNMIQKYSPTIDQTQQNIDQFNQEAQKWQQESEKLRNSMPNPEDMNIQGAPTPEDLQKFQNFAPPTQQN